MDNPSRVHGEIETVVAMIPRLSRPARLASAGRLDIGKKRPSANAIHTPPSPSRRARLRRDE